MSRHAGSIYEQDYFEASGLLHTDRIINSSRLKEAANTVLTPRYIETVKVSEHEFKLEISKFTQLDTLHFVEDSITQRGLQPDEVDIGVKAISIESRDHREAMGRGKNQRPQFGNVCAGVVTDTGRNGHFLSGDRVLVMAKNSLRSRVRTTESQLIRLPDAIDCVQACDQIPALTAPHYALIELGRWRPGDSSIGLSIHCICWRGCNSDL